MKLWSKQTVPADRPRSAFPYKKVDFDAHAYRNANKDIDQSGIDPWEHFVNYGYNEGRTFTSISDTVAVYVKIIESGYFHPSWYLKEYPDIESNSTLALKHFCDYGVWEGRDPGPHFSTSWYLEQYPDIRGMNPLMHYIEHGIREGRSAYPPRGALKTLERGFASIRDLDSDLDTNARFSWWKGVPIVDGRTTTPIKNVIRDLLSNFNSATKRIVLVPWCIHSGSDTVVANILHAAEEVDGPKSTVMIIVDHDKVEGSDWLPTTQKIVNFAAASRNLSWDDRRVALEKLILAVGPDACLNVNSHLTWELFKHRGGPLSSYTNLFACMFCPDYNEQNRPAGYAHTHFRDSLPYLYGIISDNESFPRTLESEFGLLHHDTSKFSILRQPVRAKFNRNRNRSIHNRGLNVLWAGRISRQKNYKLLSEIIALSPPNFHFSIYGWGDENSVNDFNKLVYGKKNVTVCGAYKGFESLPLETFDAYLYTSLWDGIPNALLEGAAYGLPIVASSVGGIGEVIASNSGWLIEDIENPEKYVVALEDIFKDKEAAFTKSKNLRAYVAEAHSWQNFCDRMSQPGAFLGTLE